MEKYVVLSYFSMKTYIMGSHLKCLGNAQDKLLCHFSSVVHPLSLHPFTIFKLLIL